MGPIRTAFDGWTVKIGGEMPGNDRKNDLSRPLRARQKLFTRQILLNAAVEVIVEVGYSAATIEDIAQAAGTSRQTFYQYFPSKADVVLELIERKQRTFDEVFATLFAMAAPTIPQLRGWVQHAIEVWYPASPEHNVVQQAVTFDAAVRTSGHEHTLANLNAVASYLRSQNPPLGGITARIRACHLVAEFEMLPYLRLLGIPGGAAAVVDTLVTSWHRALTQPDLPAVEAPSRAPAP
jgi:AcrR family transcriptional regulator